MKWNKHVDYILGKAYRNLGFIKRNLYHCNSVTKERAYFALVRPGLEYASSLWDPAQITLIKKIERLQRKAVRFVSGNRSREEGVVSGLLAERNWLSLQSRRKTSRLCMVFRMVNNLVGLEVCDYFKFKSSATRSRHNLQFQRFSCGSEGC